MNNILTYLKTSRSVFLRFTPLTCLPILLIVFSCSRQKDTTTFRKEQLLYNMQYVTPDVASFKAAVAQKPIFLKVKDMIDFTTTRAMRSVKENILVYMVKFKNKDQFYAVKINNSLATDELLFSREINDDKNGTIAILKNNEAVKIEFKDGVRTITDMSKPEYKYYFSGYHGGRGFCQRQSGETFGQCFKAETDEFCDSFISCVALASNPSVSIVIGIACSCNVSLIVPDRPDLSDSLIPNPSDSLIPDLSDSLSFY